MLPVAHRRMKAQTVKPKPRASHRRVPLVAKAKRTNFPGIVAAARKLGVHRNHLWLVLSGRRESRSLVARYKALR
jgi:hypothetical protein